MVNVDVPSRYLHLEIHIGPPNRTIDIKETDNCGITPRNCSYTLLPCKTVI